MAIIQATLKMTGSKDITTGMIKIGGAWKIISAGNIKIEGVWKTIFGVEKQHLWVPILGISGSASALNPTPVVANPPALTLIITTVAGTAATS